MPGILQGRAQLRAIIARRRVGLGLGHEQRRLQPRASQVGAPQVGPGKVGQPQVSRAQPRAHQAGTAQAGAAQVGACQVRADQVSAPQLRPEGSGPRSDLLADRQQQRVDLGAVRAGVQRGQAGRVAAAQAVGHCQRRAQLAGQRIARPERECAGQVPGQLVQLAHDPERAEHRPGQARLLPPVPSGARLPRHPLTGPEAVVGGTAGEPRWPQPVVDGAAEAGRQVTARLARGLGERELGRRGERRRRAAQPEAARAVSPQLGQPGRGGRPSGIAFIIQGLDLRSLLTSGL